MSQQKKSLCAFAIARCQILLEGSGGHKNSLFDILKSLISHIVMIS